MSLDDATAQFLKQMSEAGGKPLHEMTPEEARAMGGALGDLYGKGPEMARVEEAVIQAADGGSFGARVLVPVEDPRAVIVYYHGGGWVIGALDEFDTLGRTLAHRTGCAVVLVDYRLAPEHRYPVAARDAYDALCWAAAKEPDLPIIVAGDSAGGNLSAVVAQRSRDEGGPATALQVLVYPVTDHDLDTASYTDPANQLMLSRDSMIWFWDHYAPDPATRANPDASPLRARDLSGLPPAVVLTAEHDVLRDEGEAYARRLREAGVPVLFKRFEGQMHVFFTMVNVLPGSAAAITMVVEAIDGSLR
ncbi:alpha/beta hydrolase [Nonomuraea sp. NPDC003709]|uniref:alpha/beta hydrolase n=1 Tax=Nonomuraea sp. NPDC003709 TaxID=3154450 RepID=UPI0033B17E95